MPARLLADLSHTYLMDIEASGLGEASYPIEIAYASLDRRQERDFLIMPAPEWCYWDEMAEDNIHHIPRELLYQHGISPFEACRLLNRALADKTVLVDGYVFDQFWLTRLFDEEGMQPAFRLQSLQDLPPELIRLQQELLVESLQHRALPDARALRDTLHAAIKLARMQNLISGVQEWDLDKA